MPSISSPGVGSNLDVASIVSQLMNAESRPLVLLGQREAKFNAKLSAFGLLKSGLSTLQTSAQKLGLSSTFTAVKAAVADTAILSASATGTTTPGAFNIEVQQLAQPQKLVSSGFAATDTRIGTGTLTIDIGEYSDAQSTPVSFTPKSGSSAVSITIDETNNTLEGIRDAINESGAGVSATILNDGSGNRLALTAAATGVAGAVRIGVAETGDAGLAALAYDASTAAVSNLTQNMAPANALLKIDGVAVSKPTNTITDAIAGVTLNLQKTTEAGDTTRLTLTRDSAAARSAIDSFVNAYNTVNKQIADATAVSATTGKGSILTGDATMRSIQSQLRSKMSEGVSGSAAGMSTLSDLGISFQKDGSLAIDNDKLNKALNDPSKNVQALFGTGEDGTQGYGARINNFASGLIFGEEALLNGRIDGINDAIKAIGSDREVQNLRLASIEKRYLAQFSALDVMISSMNSTSAFLSQQIAALQANQQ